MFPLLLVRRDVTSFSHILYTLIWFVDALCGIYLHVFFKVYEVNGSVWRRVHQSARLFYPRN
jgi:hypothetical protein